jgi:PilZ domain
LAEWGWAVMSGADKRQFGRRESNIRGYILVAGYQPVPCTVRNISDGGALLECKDQIAATRSVRLSVEGTEFNIRSEVVHQGPRGIGIRFISTVEGAALNSYFQSAIVTPVMLADATAPDAAPIAAKVEDRPAPQGNREFRQSVMDKVFDKFNKLSLAEAQAMARDKVMQRMRGAAFGIAMAFAMSNSPILSQISEN